MHFRTGFFRARSGTFCFSGVLAPKRRIPNLRHVARSKAENNQAEEALSERTISPSPSLIPPLGVPTLDPTSGPSISSISSQSYFIDWIHGSKIHYVVAGPPDGPAVLLAPGFGVGTFHYNNNITALAEQGLRVYAIDLIGQGKSWPPADTPKDQLQKIRYSAETWVDQLEHVIETVIGGPAFVAGNSLGGFLGVHLAARRPDLISGLILLNATPFWSFQPNEKADPKYWETARKFGMWDGTGLCNPSVIKVVKKWWWDNLRSPDNIKRILQLVYAKPECCADLLVRDIIEPTEHPLALYAFASIVFSPKPELSFEEALDRIRAQGTPLVLLYGKDDPWVVPLWGQRLKRRVPNANYYEITPSGHCPAHETPEPVNSLITHFVESVSSAVARRAARAASPMGASSSSSSSDARAADDAGGGAAAAGPLPPLPTFRGLSIGESTSVGGITVSLTDGRPRNPFEFVDAWMAQLTRSTVGPLGSTAAPTGLS